MSFEDKLNDIKLKYDLLPESYRKVAAYIAENFVNNVRELKGAFNKVSAYAEFSGSGVTLALAKKALNCEARKKDITIANRNNKNFFIKFSYYLCKHNYITPTRPTPQERFLTFTLNFTWENINTGNDLPTTEQLCHNKKSPVG